MSAAISVEYRGSVYKSKKALVTALFKEYPDKSPVEIASIATDGGAVGVTGQTVCGVQSSSRHEAKRKRVKKKQIRCASDAVAKVKPDPQVRTSKIHELEARNMVLTRDLEAVKDVAMRMLMNAGT
jgi:hypothetical protein